MTEIERAARRMALEDVQMLAEAWGADPLGLSAAKTLLGELDITENKILPWHEAVKAIRKGLNHA